MKLSIEIDDPALCYIAGQTVRGHVNFESNTASTITGVMIECIGRASTKFWVRMYDPVRKERRRRERYERLIYFQHAEQHSITNVPEGLTKLPFAFQLPFGTPSSFNAEHGHIVYFIEATVQRSWKFNIIRRQYFSLNAMLDLNTYPGAAYPINLRKDKPLSVFCGRGLISANLHLPRSGFVGGQPLDFVLEVKNSSSRTIRTVSLNLVQECSFRAQGCVEQYETSVLTIEFGKDEPAAVGKHEERTFNGHENNFTVPPLPVTGLGGCSIISMQYYFEVVLTYSGVMTVRATVPVIIGTIPLRDLFVNMLPAAVASAPYLQQTGEVPGFSPPYAAYPDLPPPSYREAVMGTTTNSGSSMEKGPDDDGNQMPSAPAGDTGDSDGGGSGDGDKDARKFMPKYTVYGWKPIANRPPPTTQH